MFSSRVSGIAAVLCLFATACGGSGDADSQSGNSAETAKAAADPHAANVAACIATETKAMANGGGSTLDMEQVMSDETDCLVKADDGAVAAIERNLSQNSPSQAGTTAKAFAAYRAAGASICVMLSDASESWGGTLVGLEQSGCLEQVEQNLAALVDAYADLGVKAAPIADTRKDHADCYRAYDAAGGSASTTAAMTQASSDLVTCVQKDITNLEPALVQTTVTNNSRPNDSPATITASVAKLIGDSEQSEQALCLALAEAGPDGGGTLAHVEAVGCVGDASGQLFTQVKPEPEGN